MKTLRQICAATILSLTLALSVSAGDIHSPGVASTDSTTSTYITIEVVLAVMSVARP